LLKTYETESVVQWRVI